jgi:hypothetical protein
MSFEKYLKYKKKYLKLLKQKGGSSEMLQRIDELGKIIQYKIERNYVPKSFSRFLTNYKIRFNDFNKVSDPTTLNIDELRHLHNQLIDLNNEIDKILQPSSYETGWATTAPPQYPPQYSPHQQWATAATRSTPHSEWAQPSHQQWATAATRSTPHQQWATSPAAPAAATVADDGEFRPRPFVPWEGWTKPDGTVVGQDDAASTAATAVVVSLPPKSDSRGASCTDILNVDLGRDLDVSVYSTPKTYKLNNIQQPPAIHFINTNDILFKLIINTLGDYFFNDRYRARGVSGGYLSISDIVENLVLPKIHNRDGEDLSSIRTRNVKFSCSSNEVTLLLDNNYEIILISTDNKINPSVRNSLKFVFEKQLNSLNRFSTSYNITINGNKYLHFIINGILTDTPDRLANRIFS